jgi:mono/diheme cytochrome c family protein
MRNLWIALALILCAACGKNEKPPPPSNANYLQESGPPSKQPAGDAAKNYFQQTCSLCHGVDGTGNGPMAAQLNPKPRNYTDPNWQASVTDDEIRAIIIGGGQAVGKSNSMPPNPGLKDDRALLDGLVKIIRGFGKK